MSPSLLTVRVDVGVATTDNNVVTLTLPPGVTYVPGSVTKTGGTAALTIADLGGTPSAPTFQLGPSTLTAGNFIIFTVQREAGCAARTFALGGGTFKDNVTVTGTAGTTVENDPAVNPYNVNFPSLSFAQPPALNNTVVGSSYNRTFSITNGADGCTDEVNFYIVYPGGGLTLNSLTLTGFGAVTPASTSGDTLFFTISGAGVLTADGLLCNGENLQFTENFRVNTCNASTQYRAGWGCSASPSAWCQTASGSGSVSMATGVPSFTSTGSGYLNYVNMCTPFEYEFTITNNGTGDPIAAGMYAVIRHGLASFPNATNGIDNSPTSIYTILGVTINGNPVTVNYTGALNSQTMRIFGNQFGSDPDGAGVGFEDLDGDGQFDDLPVGNTVTVRVQMRYNDIVTCGATNMVPGYAHPAIGIVRNIEYSTMCNPAVTSPEGNQNGNGSFYFYGSSTQSPAVTVSPNVVNGIPFRVRFTSSPTNYFWPTNPGTRVQWRIILPPNVSVAGTGNPTWNGSAVTYTQIGDTIIVQSPTMTQSAAPMEIDLVFTCGTNGPISIPYEIHRLDDIRPGSQCFTNRVFVCNSFTVNAQGCPTPCAEGPTAFFPNIRRTDNSLGFTNSTLTTRVSAGSVGAVQLAHAKFGDTIQVSGSMRQNATFNNLYARFVLDRAAGAVDKLQPLDADVFFFTGGVPTGSATITSFSLANSTPTVQVIDWNLSSVLPGGLINDADSVYMVARYRVPINSGLPGSSNILVPGGDYRFFNINASNVEVSCNNWVPELYLLGLSNYMSSFGGDINLSGCAVAGRDFSLRDDYAGQNFTGGVEWIPSHYVDSIRVTATSGYVVTGIQYGATFYPPTSVSGNVYTFINPGTFPVNRLLPNAGGVVNFQVRYQASCAAPLTGSTTVRVFNRDFYYLEAQPNPGLANPTPLFPADRNNVRGLQYTGQPSITLNNLSGNLTAAAAIESWTFQVANPSLVNTPNIWAAIENNANVTIIQLVDLTTMMAIPSIPYPGGVWYQLSSSGLSPGQSRNYRIDFTYSTCDSDSLIVLAGWNCGSYPADPSSYGCQPRELVLRYAPVSSEVGLYQVSASPDSVNLCTPVYYEYVVNSSQAGNTVSNTFSLNLPQGMFPVPGTFEAEYPLGSGNWFSVPVLVSGTTYVFDLTLHPLYPILTGLPGTLNALGNADRQMGIRFLLTTDCSYIVNTQFVASTGAMQPCGVSAPGAGLLVQGPLTPVAGVEQGYITVNNMLSGDTLLSCSDTAEVDMVTFIVAGTTTSGGSIRIDIPSGLNYVPGSLLCSSGFCPSFSGLTVLPGGTERITLQIPSGLSPGDSMSYSILVSSEPAGNCGLHSIELNTFAESSTVLCASDPGGFCNSVQVFTGQASSDIWVEKPGLVLFSNGPGPVSSSPGNFLLDFGLTQVSGSPFSGGALIELWGITPSGPVLVQDTLFTGLLLPGDSVVLLFNVNSNLCNLTGFQINLPKEVNCICDSSFLVWNTIDTTYQLTQNEVICQGSSFTFGGTVYTTTGNYPFTFQTINGCDSTVTLNLTVNPVYTGGVQNEVICQGQSFTFGGTAYTTTGNYPYTFQTVNGCDSSVVLNLTVNPNPIAGFQLSGNPGDWEQGMPISVYDASIGAESYVYFLSDGFSTSLPSFDFTPNVSGYIFVNQQVTNIYGCWDEMSLPVWVDVPSNVYVPGAFTPGTNGINDVFMVYGNGITEFKMSIFNRWGELLFSSADIHVGWDGYFRGELCKPDVYIYLIEYSTRRAAEQTQRGGFTLIR